jgi:predicted TIM-barrel fold metal-dependent hydrolase
VLNDAHCHFFSTSFFERLAVQRGGGATAGDLLAELRWTEPGSPETLADTWVQELDRHGVARAALIASVHGDEATVAAAVRRHPTRFVGCFMLDPSTDDAAGRTRRAFEAGLRTVSLFPAMHRVPLDDGRVAAVIAAAAERPGRAVFVHCGVLSVGVRRKLGLPNRYDIRLGDPLAVARLALEHPAIPFIIPHFGAGFFREALMAAELAPNVYLDTSSSNAWVRYTPGLTLESVFRTALAIAGASRLLFGTDSSFFPRGWQKPVFEEQSAVLRSILPADADRALVMGGNFDRLFPA